MARHQRSLFGEILDWMLAPLLLLWPMSVVLTWLVAQGIANKPFDRELGAMVRALSRQITVQQGLSGHRVARFTLPTQAIEILHTDEDDEIYYQVLGLHGEWLSGDQSIAVPSEDEKPQHGELRFRDDTVRGDGVRVAYMWVDVPGREGQPGPLVQVAETLGKRSRLATEIIKGVMLPQFVILPLAVLLVWLALARGIAPLNELQQRIRRRDSGDLSPIDEGDVPEEVAPLVGAINDLLERLDQSMRTQKHFLADAAHQLKTPLAGLRTQAELAQREIEQGRSDPAAIGRSLQHIARSSQNAAHAVNQLLAMARAEDRGQISRDEWVNLNRLAIETVRDFVPKALALRIDLGYEGDEFSERAGQGTLWVKGNSVLLGELLRNLVDNALKYTARSYGASQSGFFDSTEGAAAESSERGAVTVRVLNDLFGEVVVVQVEDSGPGIAPSERERIFQPFYRALGTNVDGSGLGLAIVREIALQHGAEITVDDVRPNLRTGGIETLGGHHGPGARFSLRFHASATRYAQDGGLDQSADEGVV